MKVEGGVHRQTHQCGDLWAKDHRISERACGDSLRKGSFDGKLGGRGEPNRQCRKYGGDESCLL